MGSSGAGKTTLMNVIAGRKTGGKITGEILLNGHPATDLITRRSTGYCIVDGVAKLEKNNNPATWMLEVIGAGVGNDNGDMNDFVTVFKESQLFEELEAGMTRGGVFRPSPSVPALEYTDKRAATELTQAKFLMRRFFLIYWRTASYNLTRFFISIFLGLLFGLTYGSADYSTYAGTNSGMGMLYASTGFFGFVSFSGAVPVASTERLSFYRERAAQTYNAFWYFVASTIVEIPYVFISTLLFVGIFFPMVDVATIFGVLIISIFLLFSGFNPPGDSIPQGYKWIYDIDPMKYSLAILASIIFGDCSMGGSRIGCKPLSGAPSTLLENLTDVESVFSIKHSELHKSVAFIVGFIILYRILALLALRYINHVKR
ncbi:Pleiotropic drug resistance protein transporter [Phytophthora megakarya]|uniref:Pleiotropic drug resistance protein transporter n=1 Tax=Phytophthora megakarya TaxID=4795 RepID=A0A225WGJ9_9STRA|nr:Pleiotropic drug resistance protein transporter [Phytophthora megakarya]